MFAAFSSHYILRQIRAGNGWPPICGHYRGGLVSLLWVSAEWRDPRSVSRCNCPRLSWRQPLLRDQRFRSGTPVCFAPVHERATRQSEGILHSTFDKARATLHSQPLHLFRSRCDCGEWKSTCFVAPPRRKHAIPAQSSLWRPEHDKRGGVDIGG